MQIIDLGVENGIHTWQVLDDAGNHVGFNQSVEDVPQ